MPLLAAPQIERIQRNYRGGDLSATELIDLLQHKVAPGAERASRELVRRMMEHAHFNRAAHTQGSRDATVHYTVYVNDRGHHLRLDSSGIIFQITDQAQRDLGVVPPWVAPGA
jgi:hypothetical protein